MECGELKELDEIIKYNNVAIRSLEAWEKVKEEMDNCHDYYELGSMILKHLKEVENTNNY